MAGLNNGAGFEDDPLDSGCYSQLLLADDFLGLETDECFGFNNSAKMLCFGDPCNLKTGQESELACTGSEPVSSRNTKISTLINEMIDGSGSELIEDPRVDYGAPTRGQRQSNKKLKLVNSRVINRGHAKVAKKEKLGERITTLQKLVSPFGKTDTASVLHEALGYIRFLQDQVQVLCSPYLHGLPPSSPTHNNPGSGENRECESKRDDLRSRGLCLVPVELTLHVAESNGADLWSSAAMLNNVSSN